MAYFSPTIATKRSSTAGEGRPAGLLISFMSGTLPWSGRARKPVVDGLTQPVMRHRHNCDCQRADRIKRAQMREQIGCCLHQIAMRREIEHAHSSLRACRQLRAKGQKSLASTYGSEIG